MADIHAHPAHNTVSRGIIERDCKASGIKFDVKEGRATANASRTARPLHPANPEAIEMEPPVGVQQMEAITLVWTKKWLVIAYALITLIFFVNSLQQQVNFAFTPWVTSSFQQHGLTAMTSLVANIVSGVSKLPLAMFINVCGRPQGFTVCLLCVVLALIMMAFCQNVQTYAAAQVFYWTGLNGMGYVLDIFIADTSLLKNRLIWLAIVGSPYICNTFAGPSLADTFIHTMSWRWGYGIFAIITPVMCIPFWAIFYFMTRKARKSGVIATQKSNRTFSQSVVHWCNEFDVIGLVLICGGFCTLLLPFSFATNLKLSWDSSQIVSMIVMGVLLLVLFGFWEFFLAPKTFFPFYLMKDRSVVGACLLGFFGWITFYSYKMFYSSYLQLVFSLSIAKAGYIVNIYSLVSCAWAVIISLTFKYRDTYRWAAFIAIPIQILMAGLLIKFREPGTHIALLVMVEVLYGMGGAVLVQIENVAVMAAVPHENVATGLALLAMLTSVGGAVGQTVSGAIWTNIVPRKLVEYLPQDRKHLAPAMYADLGKQLSYPFGSPEREAMIAAASDAQKIMLIAGTCALVPCMAWVALLKNNRLSEHKSGKGLQM